jgi:hypothetical protein
MRFFAAVLFSLSALHAINEGELRFRIGAAEYATANALGLIQARKGKTRICIAVKDVASQFMLVMTADVEAGAEAKPLVLTTEDSALAVSIRTRQGAMAVMPPVQLAQDDPNVQYAERFEVDSGETEDDPDFKSHDHNGSKKKRRRIRSEYRRVKPAWHGKSKGERLRSGDGLIGNDAFREVYFSLRLVPVVTQGKVVSYTGSFSGTGRFARSISGAEIKPIEGGTFRVRVEHAP